MTQRLTQREGDLQRAIMRALPLAPHVVSVTRVHSGKVKVRGGWMELAPEGTPDLLVCLRGGKTLWIETKTEIGKLSETQRAWHARHRTTRHAIAVCRSVQEAFDAVRVCAFDTDMHSKVRMA